jgi:hypothetical protein
MTEIKIKIKYNKAEPPLKELNLISDMKIEDLRLIIEEEFKIPPFKQNLIFKGKMLQNEKKLEDYNISNDDIILLFEKIGEEEKSGLNKVSGQAGIGVRGQINYDLLKQPMGFGGNINQVMEAMKIPEIAGQVESMMDDPNIIDAMMENPQIKALCDMNPAIKSMITNKEFMKSMFSPENLEKMKNIQEGNFNQPQFNPNLGNINNNFNFNNNNNFGFNLFNPNMMNMNMNQNNSNNMTIEQLKEKYKNEIQTIKDMGFDNEEKIINALQKTNGNINASIERLISNI